MKYYVHILLLLFFFACAETESVVEFNPLLKQELDSIYNADQVLRVEHSMLLNQDCVESGKVDAVLKLIKQYDKSNLIRIKEIIHLYGYPGKSLVGEESSDVAFFVLQHSNAEVMLSYQDIILKAGEDDELEMNRVAMYQDRLLILQERPQIYGTQIRTYTALDPETKMEVTVKEFYPIQEPQFVEKRRQAVGLSSITEYAHKNDIIWGN